jgi:hypothetical protein
VEPDFDQVRGLWTKALDSGADSRKGLSPDNAITLAYQAGFQACTALLEAHGYRTRGSNPGHHYRVFYAVSDLGHESLKDVDATAEKVKRERTKSFYSGVPQQGDQVQALHDWLDVLLPGVHAALREVVPEDLVLRKP